VIPASKGIDHPARTWSTDIQCVSFGIRPYSHTREMSSSSSTRLDAGRSVLLAPAEDRKEQKEDVEDVHEDRRGEERCAAQVVAAAQLVAAES
jgi:hypothetical protein